MNCELINKPLAPYLCDVRTASVLDRDKERKKSGGPDSLIFWDRLTASDWAGVDRGLFEAPMNDIRMITHY